MGGTEERTGAVQGGGHGGVLPPDPEGEGEERDVGPGHEAVQETLGLPMETLPREQFYYCKSRCCTCNR